MKRLFISIALLSSFILYPSSFAARRPNILFILADDLGAHDPHCFGSTFHEPPNIDALAARGVKFTQAYAAEVGRLHACEKALFISC